MIESEAGILVFLVANELGLFLCCVSLKRENAREKNKLSPRIGSCEIVWVAFDLTCFINIYTIAHKFFL